MRKNYSDYHYMIYKPETEGDCSDSESADSDAPEQPRLNSRKFSDFDAQCNKIHQLMGTEMAKYDLIQRYWHTLTDDERDMLMTMASEKMKQGGAEPRVSYFWMWMWEHRKDSTLNYSDFARLIGVSRHVVPRQLLPQAIRCFVMWLDQLLLAYLTVTCLPD
jgi:hypothetical protein